MAGSTGLIGRDELAPVTHKWRWIGWGLVLQLVGVGIPLVTAISRAHREGILAGLDHYTISLLSREMFRSRADVALIILGVVLFVAGSVVLSRPFVSRRLTLLVAVPIAAVAGLAVGGVIALIVGAFVAMFGDELASISGGGGGGGGSSASSALDSLASTLDPGSARRDDDRRR